MPSGIRVAGTTAATTSGDCVQPRKKKPSITVEGKDKMMPDNRELVFSARNVSKATKLPPAIKLTTS